MFGMVYYFLWAAGATASMALWLGNYGAPSEIRLAISLIPVVITLFVTAMTKT